MYNESSNDSPALGPAHHGAPAPPPSPLPHSLIVRFSQLTDTILLRLRSIAEQLSTDCLHALQQAPEHYDPICTYHLSLLAQHFRRELDILFDALCLDTLTIVERAYRQCSHQPDQPT